MSLIGSDKILFASDFPLVKPKFIKKQLDISGNSELDIFNVVYANAKKLFKL